MELSYKIIKGNINGDYFEFYCKGETIARFNLKYDELRLNTSYLNSTEVNFIHIAIMRDMSKGEK